MDELLFLPTSGHANCSLNLPINGDSLHAGDKIIRFTVGYFSDSEMSRQWHFNNRRALFRKRGRSINMSAMRVWTAGWEFRGDSKGGRWWEGELVDQVGQSKATVTQGVIDFTGGADFWPLSHLRQLDQANWLRQNWRQAWQQAQDTPVWLETCRQALTAPGPLLELAAGPGGGNLSPFLHLDPERQLLVNDLEPRLLSRWSTFLDGELPKHRVIFTAFDLTKMPLADVSLGCISAVGGLGSIQGDPQAALNECVRVLRPGGLLAVIELSLTAATVARLPAELQALWSNSPWLLGRWPQLLERAGLTVISDRTIAAPLSPVDGLWQDAAYFGVKLETLRHYLLIIKR
jgi:ubiquinone/menaquinone biosynthesis C-methylase UbiE